MCRGESVAEVGVSMGKVCLNNVKSSARSLFMALNRWFFPLFCVNLMIKRNI